WLRDLVSFSAAIAFLATPITVLLPVVVRQQGLPGAVVGLVLGALGIGSVAANLWLANLMVMSHSARARLVFLLSIGFGLGAVALGMSLGAVWMVVAGL